jgi:glutathione synthase/RimK-type ligase-like ATP-grasp enzyme
MKQHADRMDEERFELQNFARELRPIAQPIATAAHRALQMDYFGIDCHLNRNGDAVLFEANANMDIIKTGRAEMAPYVNQPFDALAQLIRQRLALIPR